MQIGLTYIVLFIVIAIIVLLVLFIVGVFNALVRLRNQVENAWSQIDVQLKRRHDLIPNLVETAKGYMEHERGTFEAVTKARSQAMDAKSVSDASKAEGALGEALSKFLLVVENYPELKANQNFLSLQEELTSTENKISFARQNYNDQVLFFNNKIQMFPSNIIANMFNFAKRDFFEIEAAEEREVPQVSFSKEQ
jgi:LemA protein